MLPVWTNNNTHQCTLNRRGPNTQPWGAPLVSSVWGLCEEVEIKVFKPSFFSLCCEENGVSFRGGTMGARG